MGFPLMYFLLDVVANAVFGYFLVKGSKDCGCGGNCKDLKLWALVVGIILIVFAVFHLLVILNQRMNGRLSRIPLLGDILNRMWMNWQDIYLICMVVIWGWALILVIMNNHILKCDKHLITIAEIYIVFSLICALLYGSNRNSVTNCDI